MNQKLKSKYSILLFCILIALAGCKQKTDFQTITITYPFNQAVFPADIVAPTIRWKNDFNRNTYYKISIVVNGRVIFHQKKLKHTQWKPSQDEWQEIKLQAKGSSFDIIVESKSVKDVVTIHISNNEVEAPIFFRAVPLPFKFARENLKRIRWHYGHVKNEEKPHVVLDNIPVCANCHSFSGDGQTVAMDVDARDDKGAYALATFNETTNFEEDSLIHWSDMQDGKFTYGLLSQISPNGRYVVSTLKDCEIFADRNDLEYSQLFFPVKGILVIYDRKEKKYFELAGANDTTFVQSNPCWSPDGNFIYFTRAKAKHYEESGLHNGSVPQNEDYHRYKKFENNYMSRDSLMKFDIYRIPFNSGKGGIATAVEGASHNGKSNYFPKISPNGKWMVFCQAESFMLLQKDSKLVIKELPNGATKVLNCNSENMNSWHSWSPNSKWLVFSTKAMGPYTQLFLTHIDSLGKASPAVHLEKFSFDKYANNIPEFVNTDYNPNLKINPAFLSANEFIVRTGEIKEKEGDIDGAYHAYDQAIKQFPSEAEPYYKRGYISFVQGNMLPAINDFSKAITLQPHSDYYTYRGLAYLKLGKYDDVIKDLNKASKLAPQSFTPYAYIGVAYLRTQEFSKAVDALNRAVELYQEDALSYYYLALANYSLKNWMEAEQAVTVAMKLGLQNSPKNPLNTIRGESRFHLNDYTGAIPDLTEAIKVSPKDAELFYMLGKAQRESGLKKEAIKNLLNAKKLGSDKVDKLLAE